MSHIDYDLTQPKHTPIILSILITIVFIFICTIGLVYYFKSSLKIQEDATKSIKSNGFNLTQLRQWEKTYLNSSNRDKINIDDAIYITITRYNH